MLAANAGAVAAGTHVTSITLSDTAANVTTYLGTLETIVGQLASFALTDGGTPTQLTITGAQFTGDSGVLGKITSAYHLTVTSALASIAGGLNSNTHVTSAGFSDTAANVSANIDALQTLGSKVSGVTLTDGGTPALAITYTQLINDQTTLNTKISGSFTITVSAVTAANATTAAWQGQRHLSPARGHRRQCARKHQLAGDACHRRHADLGDPHGRRHADA